LAPTPEVRFQALAAVMPTFMAALRTPAAENGQGRLRIMLRAPERQPAEQKEQLIRAVDRLARQAFPEEQDSAVEVTGFFVVLTRLVESILSDQWVTFGVASAGIIAMIWLGFRSLAYALIAM